MNIFRFGGDVLHLASILILLLKIYHQKSCRGISLKTQILYVLVFVTRYLDLFTNYVSLYNFAFKIFFISSSMAIVYLMRFRRPYCLTYQKAEDSFLAGRLIVLPCALLALFVNEYFTFIEVLWAFSIYLEALAILPQLFVVHSNAVNQNGFVENLTSDYVFSLGGYRALYLLNWIYRYLTEDNYSHWIVWIAGTIQTIIYCDFFYYYVISKVQGKNMSLPI